MTPEEVFFKLNKLQRAAIVVILGILLLAAFYLLVVSGMLAQIDKIQLDIGKVKNQIVNEEKTESQGPMLKKAIEEENRKLKGMVGSLPERQEIEDVLKKITDLLAESNLVSNSFTPGGERRDAVLQYATIPISMNVRGDFFKQGAFLASLNDLPRIVNVPEIKLKRSGGLSGRESDLASKLGLVTLDGDITAETYRRLTAAEAAAARKPPPKGKKRAK